jgi:hypothetical protein
MTVRKQIDEFTQLSLLEALTGTHIFHTKSTGNRDKKATVQEILDLVPLETPPAATMTASDLIAFADADDGGLVKTATISALEALLSIPVLNTDYQTDGSVNIGTFQVRWGTFSSNTDDPQTVSFSTSFTTACFFVGLQRIDGNSSLAIPLDSAPTQTDFTINRKSDVDGTFDVMFWAVGH